MPIFSATTVLPARAAAEALAQAVETLDPAPYGIGVFEVEDGSGLFEIGAHFEEAPDDVGLALLAAVHGARAFAVSEVPDIDWVAHVRRELAPVEAGRFFVYGAHDADKVPPPATADKVPPPATADKVPPPGRSGEMLPPGRSGEMLPTGRSGDARRVPLLIEASMAFGTGHHGTTLGCLLAVEDLAAGPERARIIDIGCGTAVLAMAAARVWPDARILASDIDDVAVDVARVNVAANGLVDRIDCLAAAGFDAPAIAEAGPFDLIFANILKGPLMALAAPMARRLSPGGVAVLSGILNEQAEAIVAHYAQAGINERSRRSIGDWTTLIMVRSH